MLNEVVRRGRVIKRSRRITLFRSITTRPLSKAQIGPWALLIAKTGTPRLETVTSVASIIELGLSESGKGWTNVHIERHVRLITLHIGRRLYSSVLLGQDDLGRRFASEFG